MKTFYRKRKDNDVTKMMIFISAFLIIIPFSFYKGYYIFSLINLISILFFIMILKRKVDLIFQKIELLKDKIVFYSAKNSHHITYDSIEFRALDNKCYIKLTSMKGMNIFKLTSKEWENYQNLRENLDSSISKDFDYESFSKESAMLLFSGLFS